MLRKHVFPAIAGVVALVGSVALANSELDGPAKAPKLIVQELNPATNTLTTYQVQQADESVRPEALERLSAEERKARVEAFLKRAAVPANKVGEEKVEAEKVSSELDGQGSTSSHWRRWRRCYGGGGYYGASFYAYYGGSRYHYQPYWGYGGYGYYGSYQGAYYGGGYYAGGYVVGGQGCYGLSYSVYGYGW